MNSFIKKFINIKVAFLVSFTTFDFVNLKKVSADINQIPSQEYIRNFPQDDFYIIGPGDVLKIDINEFTFDLNNVFAVSGEGFIKITN